LNPSPILKVLSTFKKTKVKALLIGGQACIVYGAAEFSRDSDFVVFANPSNLDRLRKALKSLGAEPVYFPALTPEYLQKGHACHFRCGAPGVEDLRVDVMGRLRGCSPFPALWRRRKRVKVAGVGVIDVISIKDLAQCKKTQRDKDWLMLARLVENSILLADFKAPSETVSWWLLEARSPRTLVRLCGMYQKLARRLAARRTLLKYAIAGQIEKTRKMLMAEERLERTNDKLYWDPLKKELETLRLNRDRKNKLKFIAGNSLQVSGETT
jgi:hypothetical protein